MITLQDLAIIYDFPENLVEVFPQFEDFLRDKDAHNSYINYILGNSLPDNGYKSMLKEIEYLSNLIKNAFPWSSTQEDHDYWEDLDREWREICMELGYYRR